MSSRMGFLQRDVNVHKGIYTIGLLLALKCIVVRAWGNQLCSKTTVGNKSHSILIILFS